MTDDLVERAAHAANIKRTNMTEISKEWCINMAKQEEGDIGAGKLAIDPTSDNFHKLALSESFERVAKVAEERQEFNEQMALNDRGAQVNTIEELRAANERWVIAFKQAEADATGRIEALQAAVMAVVDAVRDYLPPDGISEKDFISRVIGAVDNPTINPVIFAIEAALQEIER